MDVEFSNTLKIINLLKHNRLSNIKQLLKDEITVYNGVCGTLIHLSILLRNLPCMKRMLNSISREEGIKWISIQDRYGRSPLDLSIKYNSKEITIFLNEYLDKRNKNIENKLRKIEDENNYEKMIIKGFADTIIKEGPLEKYINFAFGYRNRHLVLKKDKILYYGCRDTGKELKEIFALHEITVDVCENQNSFILVDMRNRKKYIFRTETPEEAVGWVLCIEDTKYENTFDQSFFHFSLVGCILKEYLKIKGENLVCEGIVSFECFTMFADLFEGINIEDAIEKEEIVAMDVENIKTPVIVGESDSDSEKFYDFETENTDEILKSDSLIQVSSFSKEDVRNDEFKVNLGKEEFFDATDGENQEEKNEFLTQERVKLPVTGGVEKKELYSSLLNEKSGNFDIFSAKFPMNVHEPLSLLQRMTEDLIFKNILDKINGISDGCLRMAYVSGFIVSSFFHTKHRIFKPFTPLLGETFYHKLENTDIYCEQVSLNPNISALHAENQNFIYESFLDFSSSLKSKKILINHNGNCKLILKDKNEIYSWKKVDTVVKGFESGDVTVLHNGKIELECGDIKGIIKIKPSKSRDEINVCGSVKQKNKTVYSFKGIWDKYLLCRDMDTGNEFYVYESNERRFPEYYNMTKYSFQLNFITSEIESKMFYTDSRYRPDTRALEYGQFANALENNEIIENRQRVRKNESRPLKPRFFEFNNNLWTWKGCDDTGKGERIFEI
ncbi:oxysterol-binding protein [Hamiltosporidium tvaerminnensis]|uniref:Oxysterol-binding protein n=1 Tax=Hamiltosporidium tvaerminnensis TaxID=1176355 RepID=A0A4Q9LEF0_9MICR|nr:hypothetical protein LUQ84_001589 [Hamiltosporidium tvaerminnensis]TBU05441.1 oxysterol-binding protein [Hamiltosporidium tvaerminnensis]